MNVVALRPAPRFDQCRVVAVSFIPRGRFEALGPRTGQYGGKWRFGRLGLDLIPTWATRVHLHPEDARSLAATVLPDAEASA